MHKMDFSSDYQNLLPNLLVNGHELHQNLIALLEQNNIKVHDVSYRIKTVKSVLGKVARPDKIYTAILDITDLIGIRVVTYFEDSIEAVAQLVEQNFRVDFERSVDKRLYADPSSFGYRSLHYVCLHGTIDAPFPFEIQIRTILQHAWAEIEHDLGYKFPEAVPLPVKRRFSRLAGLLEIADAEFVELRRTMDSYEREVMTEIRPPLYEIGLDGVVLKSLVESQQVTKADKNLARLLEREISETIFYPDYLIRMLQAAKLDRAPDISNYLKAKGHILPEFMKRYFAFTSETWGFSGFDFDSLPKAYSLFLLAHFKVLESSVAHGIEGIKVFYQIMDYPHNEAEATRVALLFSQFFSDWIDG